jgi:hypothetical protein
MRLAGAALIDEDDVALGLDAAKELAQPARELRGALAWTAGEKNTGSAFTSRLRAGRTTMRRSSWRPCLVSRFSKTLNVPQ